VNGLAGKLLLVEAAVVATLPPAGDGVGSARYVGVVLAAGANDPNDEDGVDVAPGEDDEVDAAGVIRGKSFSTRVARPGAGGNGPRPRPAKNGF
jgi:SpoVK/Ycf46/Vps4 family AAA+-type ATPase